MQNINQAKKENAQSFFAKGTLVPKAEDVALSQDRVFKTVSKHYLNYQDSNMRNRFSRLLTKPAVMLSLAAICALLVIVPVLVFSSKDDSSQTSAKLKSEVAYIEGTVEYKSQDGEWTTAQKDLILKEGSSIRTGVDSKTIVNLDDGSSIRLNSDSIVTLASMDSNHIVVSNEQGEVYARVAKLDRDFDIKAGDITYESLGTAYKTVNTEEIQGVEVYHSKVNILGVNGSDEILVEQGNRYYIVNSLSPDLAFQVSEISLEEIAQDEFVLWNKEQDEMVDEFKSQMGVLFDLVPPVLEVASPADGLSTKETSVNVSGTTEVGAIVTVNGSETANNEGGFSIDVSLNEGANSIKVVSKDAAGNLTVKNLTVTRTVDAPVVPAPTAKITLTGVAVDQGVSLSWNVSGLDTSKGFKVVKSTSPNPVYPGSNYAYLDRADARSYTWKMTDGVTYHFRVCQYLWNGTCGTYSNDITVTAPKVANSNPVSSITLVHNGGVNFSWSVVGYSEKGFKLVWAEGSTPVYPGSDYNYYSNPATTSGVIDGTAGKTYNVRVCEYLGGACGTYSNMITITL